MFTSEKMLQFLLFQLISGNVELYFISVTLNDHLSTTLLWHVTFQHVIHCDSYCHHKSDSTLLHIDAFLCLGVVDFEISSCWTPPISLLFTEKFKTGIPSTNSIYISPAGGVKWNWIFHTWNTRVFIINFYATNKRKNIRTGSTSTKL